jgi:hypothetical protein
VEADLARVSDLDPLNEEETRCARRKFTRHLFVLGHIEVFFVPSIRGIITRSVNAQREFRLPPGSILIGTYAHPNPKPESGSGRHDTRSVNDGRLVGAPHVDDFLGDLDDVLAKQRVIHASRNIAPAV